MKVSFFICLTLVFSSTIVSGQKRTNATGYQSEPLAKKLNTYSNHHIQEKIYIHTDRSSYITGETIWFKVYCIEGSTHRAPAISKVAYLELLDADSKAVLQTKIALNEDGTGNGTVFLPASLTSGNYLLRAYTNWMKNAGADLYYHQPITIINPFVNFTPSPSVSEAKYDVQFFPEGGNLVNGLESVVGFRAVDQSGKGIEFNGVIINEKNDTITTFSPLKFGIGRFTFTPSADHEYRAVITDTNQRNFSYKLPAAFDEGVALHLTETSDIIKIILKTVSKIKPNNSTVHLLAHTRQQIVMSDTRSLQDGETIFILDKKLLAEGISHITIFDDNLIPVCERLYFKKPAEKLSIDARPQSVSFAPRKKVNIPVNVHFSDENNTTVNLSAAIYKIDSLESDGQNIVNYLMLTSDLKGNIESPDYYFEKENSTERIIVSDNLLLTHGWTRFKWEDVAHDNKLIEYAPEYNGHIINGRVTELSTGNPAKGILTYLTPTGINSRPYASLSNEHGTVLFETQNFYEENELLVQLNARYDSLYKVEIFSPFSEKRSACTLPALNLNQASKNIFEQRSIHMQVQSIFFKNQMNQFKKQLLDSTSFYGPPDKKYNLDDYTRFPTMEEVMREYVKGVLVRKQNDVFRFSNYDLVNRTYFDSNPFVMLDGVPIFSINKIIAMDPHLVKSVEVLNRRYYFGVSMFEGIISYRTYKGDMGGLQPDVKTLMMNYDGLQSDREFFAPVYETPQQQESTIPDTRNLLYWSSSVMIDKEGKGDIHFYTSDITGKYKVVIQGITKNGVPCYSSSSFEVSTNK
jgi:hypothetical protein